MKVYVIDASIAARFLLVEDLSDRAELVLKDFLREAIDLRAPKLMVYEVGNTLWKAVRQGFIDLGGAKEKLSRLLMLKIDSIEFDEEMSREALDWGVKNDATYYDSAYVEASRKVEATLLTADNILYEKASKGVSTLHLRDYKGW
ncbi:MAG: type II toxin-antitoxin system VapC family toxin [Candidatus Geothermarchaeales archaeon]